MSNENSTRTHAQLYGSLCSMLQSINKVRVPPAEWAELEVGAATGSGGALWSRHLGRRLGGQQRLVHECSLTFSHRTTVVCITLPGVANFPLAAVPGDGEGQMICCAGRSCAGWRLSCCTTSLFASRRCRRRISCRCLGGCSGIVVLWLQWVSSSLVMAVKQFFPGRKRRGQAWCLTLPRQP